MRKLGLREAEVKRELGPQAFQEEAETGKRIPTEASSKVEHGFACQHLAVKVLLHVVPMSAYPQVEFTVTRFREGEIQLEVADSIGKRGVNELVP